MEERKPETGIAAELKELGLQFAATAKAVLTSEQVRSLGYELRDGLREAMEAVEHAIEKVGEREEVQRLRERAGDVADSLRSGAAQHELGKEFADAMHALSARLQALRTRLDTPALPPEEHLPAVVSPPYVGETRKLEPEDVEHEVV